MKTNNDKLFGYWVDFGKPFLANTDEGRRQRREALWFFREEKDKINTEEARRTFMKDFIEKFFDDGFFITREELIFGLQLAVREQIAGDVSVDALDQGR